jgi:orotate phosphoribosyltransferase
MSVTMRGPGHTAPGESVFAQLPAVRREELARDIVSAAYLRGDFLLSSGARSSFYFDKYLFETKPTVLRRIAALLAECVPPNVDRLAGPELGAVALAAAVSLATGLPFVIVRKTSEGYPGSKLVEGEVHPGERVLIIEDVISTAAQALRAARQVSEAGADVTGILAVVDREQGGAASIAAAGYHFDALFRLSELNI